MGQTPKYRFRFPEPTDPTRGDLQIKALAEDVEARGQDGTFKGATGQPGADGKSAFQVAKDGGFTGDEAAWLASLKGADGKQGIQGQPGERGERGEQGPPGEPPVMPGASLNLSSEFVHMADNQFKLADAGFLNGAQIMDGNALKVASSGLWVFSGVLNISSAVAAAYPLEGDIWMEWDATASSLFTERQSFYARAGGGEPPGHQSFQFTIPLKAADTVRIKFKIFGRIDDIQLTAGGMLLASEVMHQEAAA